MRLVTNPPKRQLSAVRVDSCRRSPIRCGVCCANLRSAKQRICRCAPGKVSQARIGSLPERHRRWPTDFARGAQKQGPERGLDLVGGNIATVIMIAQKAADLNRAPAVDRDGQSVAE